MKNNSDNLFLYSLAALESLKMIDLTYEIINATQYGLMMDHFHQSHLPRFLI